MNLISVIPLAKLRVRLLAPYCTPLVLRTVQTSSDSTAGRNSRKHVRGSSRINHDFQQFHGGRLPQQPVAQGRNCIRRAIVGKGNIIFRPRIPMALLLRMSISLLGVFACGAHAGSEFLLFPEVSLVRHSHFSPGLGLKRTEAHPALDIFYAHDAGQFRALAEVFISKDENEIERLQMGWRLLPETTLWVGRFHNPLGDWNSRYHHGAYVQTAISRPGIFEFEDDGGVLPMHITGVLLEGLYTGKNHGWHYSLAAGAGPDWRDGLQPVNLLAPGRGSHKFQTALKVAYRPDAYGVNEVGFFAGYGRIPGEAVLTGEIRQTVSGVYSNWGWEPVRVVAGLLFLNNRMNAPHQTHAAARHGYLQAEVNWRQDWTFYARVEDSHGGDAYLGLFPDFVKQRTLAGVRYDFTPRQTLKLEVSNTHLQTAEFRQVVLQWSAVWP